MRVRGESEREGELASCSTLSQGDVCDVKLNLGHNSAKLITLTLTTTMTNTLGVSNKSKPNYKKSNSLSAIVKKRRMSGQMGSTLSFETSLSY